MRGIVIRQSIATRIFAFALCAACVFGGYTKSSAFAPPAGPSATSETAAEPEDALSLWGILNAGGIIGWLIILMSVGAAALVIEHVWTIRAGVIMPEGLGQQVRDLVAAGQWTKAHQQCKLQPSVLGYVLQAGLSEAESGWSEVEKAMEDAVAEQSARLFRKIEYLSVIGNIAPMLGLLGTVIGMIFAFREVAASQGAARAADLAEGIYLALVTTVLGLIVAIPSLAAFAVLRNRVDQLVAETAYLAQHALAPLKRVGAALTRDVPPPPPLAGGR